MKLVWLLLVAIGTINVNNAKSIKDNVTETEVNKSAFTKLLSPSINITTTRPNSSIFPNMPNRKNKFVVNLRPTMKTEHPTTKNIYSKHVMKKLQIKPVNYNVKARLPAEITTRKPLMQIRRFTVKPHDIYVESGCEKHNWNNNRKITTNNFSKSKSERYTTETNFKPSDEEESSEQKFLNFKNVDSSINDNESKEIGKEEKKNSYVAAGSQNIKTILLPKRNNKKHSKVDPGKQTSERTYENKSVSEKKNSYVATGSQNIKTILLPKRNNKKHSKVDPVQKTSERTYENKSVSENKISSDVVNNPNGNVTENKEKSITTNKVLMKSESKDNFSDQEKADRSEFMLITGVEPKGTSLVPVVAEVEMSTNSGL